MIGVDPLWLSILGVIAAASIVAQRYALGCLASPAAYAAGVVMLVVLPWQQAVANWLTLGVVAALVTLTVEWSLHRKAAAAGTTMVPRLQFVALSLVAWPLLLPRAVSYWLAKEEPLTPEAEQFLADAVAEFKTKQDALQRDWGIGSGGRSGYDQETGILTLHLPDGTEAHADGQMLGSYQASDQTWEWAWNNPHVERAVARDSELVRDLGRRLGIAYLQVGKIPAPTPDAGAYFSSIGVKATASDGAYRMNAGKLEVAILLKNVRKVKPA